MDKKIFTTKTFEHSITVENAVLTFIGNEFTYHSNIDMILPNMYHSHGFAELFFCKKGELILKYSNTEHILFEGDIAFIPPKLQHFTVISKNNIIFNVGITLEAKSHKGGFDAHKKLDRLFSASEPIFFRRYSPVFPEEMTWIEEISTASLIPSLSAFHTLTRLSENYKSQLANESDINISNKKLNIIVQIENYIGGKYYENITAQQLASMLYISPRQLARIVKERFNAPLHQIIVNKRIESAAKLLAESNLSVEEISSAVGFSTKSCFYRAFKEKYNKTPLQYKKEVLR